MRPIENFTMLTASERVNKLRLWAILGLIVAVVVAIAVNRTPTSPLASALAGMPQMPIADARGHSENAVSKMRNICSDDGGAHVNSAMGARHTVVNASAKRDIRARR